MNEMTCKEFDGVMHGFVRMELLDVSLREAALEHAARCRDCAERMAEATALAEAVDAVGRGVRDQQTPPRVEATVLAEFRSHHRRAAWRRTFEWATIGAAAAVLLLFVWTFTGRSKTPSQSLPAKDVSSKSQRPLDTKLDPTRPPSSQPGVEGSAKGVAGIAGNDASVGPDPSAGNEEDVQGDEVEVADSSISPTFVASDFVPVPYTGEISADDPGMVVRVQLTRASLAQLGYPVAETPVADGPDDDLIRADVLVGEDGWPRAVKLVQ